jgi:site-specific DNA recombinase
MVQRRINMIDTNQLRYIAYVRKSEERKERQELSHSAQIRKILEQFSDLNIVKWMDAESQSAFKPGRPIFNEMMTMIEQGLADAIVSYHPNRLARNEYDSARLTYGLRGPLKNLKFCTYNFDNSPEGIMMLQMVMNQGQYESSKQGIVVKRGMQEKALQGERPGVVAIGYMKVPVMSDDGKPILKSKDNKIVTKTASDPHRLKLVARMWRLLLTGQYSPPEIRRIANDQWGFTTKKTERTGGGPIGNSTIYRIFRNPFYAGYITHNGELHKGNHEAIITLEEFDYAQKLLGSRGRMLGGPGGIRTHDMLLKRQPL